MADKTSADAQQPDGATSEQPLWQALVAGSCGGLCAVAVSHPFDTVKVRMQVGQAFDRRVLTGLYSGVFAQAAGIVPFWAFYYYGYKLGRRIFPDKSSLLQGFCAGAVAGAVSTPVVVLSEAVKTLAQVSGTSSADALRGILRSGLGVAARRMLSVTPTTLLYMMPSQGIFYASYEVASARLGSEMLAGGTAGMCEWTSSLPADTVRARVYVQVLAEGKPAAPLACVQSLWRGGGFLQFYRGIGPTWLRAFSANAAAFGGIEFANGLMTSKTSSS